MATFDHFDFDQLNKQHRAVFSVSSFLAQAYIASVFSVAIWHSHRLLWLIFSLRTILPTTNINIRSYALKIQERLYDIILTQEMGGVTSPRPLDKPSPPVALLLWFFNRCAVAASESFQKKELFSSVAPVPVGQQRDGLLRFMNRIVLNILCCVRTHLAATVIWTVLTMISFVLWIIYGTVNPFVDPFGSLVDPYWVLFLLICFSELSFNIMTLRTYLTLGSRGASIIQSTASAPVFDQATAEEKKQMTRDFLASLRDANRDAPATPDVMYWLGRRLLGDDDPHLQSPTLKRIFTTWSLSFV
eukprot:m.27513 g.27513  ORF g.27513 m.27513 type:complete len:302 (-) comp4430_c0_seq2:36-941(-)